MPFNALEAGSSELNVVEKMKSASGEYRMGMTNSCVLLQFKRAICKCCVPERNVEYIICF